MDRLKKLSHGEEETLKERGREIEGARDAGRDNKRLKESN